MENKEVKKQLESLILNELTIGNEDGYAVGTVVKETVEFENDEDLIYKELINYIKEQGGKCNLMFKDFLNVLVKIEEENDEYIYIYCEYIEPEQW